MDRDNIKRTPTRQKCMDCNHQFRVGRASAWRAARVHCPVCGSTRLEAVEKKKDDKQ